MSSSVVNGSETSAPFRLLATLFLFSTVSYSVQANPVSINPSSLIAFGVIVFAAFVVEAGIVALLLLATGLQPLRVFGAYFLTNAGVFFFVFQPLLERGWSIPLLEFVVVLLDGAIIKFLQGRESMQGDSYRGTSWPTALLVSLAGNGVSFFIGLVADRKPWIDHFIES